MHVPDKGAAPAIADLMGGQISGFFGDVPGLISHLQGGRLESTGRCVEQAPPVACQT